MSQESSSHDEPTPQDKSPDAIQNPHAVESTTPPTPLEKAILQATPEAEKAPSWFKAAVKTIADAWFDPKSFESPELYEKLGVKTVKEYMPTGGDLVTRMVRKIAGEGGWVEKNLASLKNMEHFTRLYEAVHEVAFGIMAANIGVELANGNIKMAAGATAWNILVKVFPIMLQRYNRMRLYRVINRMEAKQSPLPGLQADGNKQMSRFFPPKKTRGV